MLPSLSLSLAIVALALSDKLSDASVFLVVVKTVETSLRKAAARTKA